MNLKHMNFFDEINELDTFCKQMWLDQQIGNAMHDISK